MTKTIGLAMIMVGAAWAVLPGCAKHEPSPATQPCTSSATTETSSQPAGPTLDLGNNIAMRVVLIPSGKFMMGSPPNEQAREDDEGPQRQVTITKPFYMGMYTVTQEQYQQVMGDNHSRFIGPQNPVETLSCDEAMEFCRKLSQRTGKKVHLPTEAQWEYACRAGTTTRFSFGDAEKALDDCGWSLSNSNSKTHPVGQKRANPWGLYDMHGNVWQWCSDWYADSYANEKNEDPQGPDSGYGRVLRGGSWYVNRQTCRSAFRATSDPYGRVNGFGGFRVVVDIEEPKPVAGAPVSTSR
jgi:formylglycine-generating enzyme required for sulfatase activity